MKKLTILLSIMAFFAMGSTYAQTQPLLNNAGNTSVDVQYLSDGTTSRTTDVAFIVTDDGKVGIGTTTPGKLGIGRGLDVDGVIQATGNTPRLHIVADGPTHSGEIQFYRGVNDGIVHEGVELGAIVVRGNDGVNYSSNSSKIAFVVDATPGFEDMPGRIEFSTTADGANVSTTRMVIKNNGNVGIGTTTPGATLELKVGAGENGLWISNEGTSSIVGLSSADGDYGVLGLPNTGVITDGIALRGKGVSYINGGNVGIGIANPDVKFEVAGEAQVTSYFYFGDKGSADSWRVSTQAGILTFEKWDGAAYAVKVEME